MMSLVIIPSTFKPCARARLAQCRAPSRPCSSPGTAMNTSVASKRCFAAAQAISMTAAVPEASSLAPGASPCASMTSLLRES